MRLSRRTNTIILWVISIAMLIAMLIAYTPGQLMGNQNYTGETGPALKLGNGLEISSLDAERARQNPPYNLIRTGETGDDLQTLMLDDLVNENLLRQEASKVRVSGGEVRAAVNEFRADNGFAGSRNDQAYIRALNQQGYTDETFRDFVRDNERLEKYRDGLTEGVEVSDSEVQSYFNANRDFYRGDEKIKARQIIVSEEQLAQELRARALNGEDFTALATEYSIEGADIGGAIGGDEPTAVARLALPTQVANAAFSLGTGAVSNVVNQGGRYYVVKVEEFLPAERQEFTEVEEQVREDALSVKEAGVIETKLLELREGVDIEVPNYDENHMGVVYNYDNSVVAKVGDVEITNAELNRNLYRNPQVQNFLNPQNASFISSFFKPNTLNTMIDNELALQGADDLGIDLIGSRAAKAQSAISYVTKDADASDEEIQTYYDTNQSRYTVPASAVVNRMNFETQEAALAFQSGVASGAIATSDLEALAEEQGFELEALGNVTPGVLETELDTLLFGTEGFATVPESFGREVSDVVVIETETLPEPEVVAEESTEETTTEEGSEEVTAEGTEETTEEVVAPEPIITESFVVLVANRTAERIQGLAEVRPQVEQAVLQEERDGLRTEWLDGLRENIAVENVLFPPVAEQELTPEQSFTTTPDADSATVTGTPVVETTTEEVAATEGSVDFENTTPSETAASETAASETTETTTTETTTTETVTTETVTETATTPVVEETITETVVEETVTESTPEVVTTETVVETTTETIEAPVVVESTTTEVAATEAATETATTSDTIVEGTTTTVTETVTTTTQAVAAATGGNASRDLAQSLTSQLRTFRAAGDTDGVARTQEQLRTALRSVSGEGKVYSVQEGDTLSSISAQAYGADIYWPDILYANDFIVEDPDQIFPGLDIILPSIIGTEGPNIGQ